MDLYCVVCGACSWNKLGKDTYEEFIDGCKEMAEYIINDKDISDNRILKNIDKYSTLVS